MQSTMLVNSGYNAQADWAESLAYNTETLLDDVSKCMSASNLSRRCSKGSTGSRGGSMRIVKATSAGISPRSSVMLNRRKTLMTDSPHRRRPTMFDQNSLAAGVSNGSYDRTQAPSLVNRPVSWHASSHLAPQVSYPSTAAYPISGYDFNNTFNTLEQTSTPAVYSGYASPASAFSPLSQPFTDYRQPSFQFTDDSFFPSTYDNGNNVYPIYQPVEASQEVNNHSFSNSDNMDPTMYSHFDWDNFATNGFDAATAPPTPENFLPIQQPDPSFEAEESIPYQPLEDSESGEVLVGMGLYDTPEKAPDSELQLDNYRALMMSQLLGTVYRKQEAPASTGKGLKLEETWNPPPSDDDEDDEGEDDDDADGSEVEESSEETQAEPTAPTPITASVAKTSNATNANQIFTDKSNRTESSGNAWL